MDDSDENSSSNGDMPEDEGVGLPDAEALEDEEEPLVLPNLVIPLPDPRQVNPEENEFDMEEEDLEAAGPSAESDESGEDVERVPFNVDLPSTHQYLQLPRADDSLTEFKPVDPDSVLTVSIIKLPIIMFPNQLLPFHANDNVTVRQLLDASRTGALIALKPDFVANKRNIATLIQVVQVSAVNEQTVSIHALGRQRCIILKERSAINGMRYGHVKVLDDKELLPFIPYDVPRGWAILKSPKRIAVYSKLTAHQPFIIEQSATRCFVQSIVRWLSSWFPEDKIQSNLALGLTSFSFWVAANIPVDSVTRLEFLEESCTDRRLVNECNQLKTIDQIVCRRCSNTLCRSSDIISISTEGNSALYVNPGGYVHDMFTVSKLISTRSVGSPSEEYSWFPGYKWTIQNCARCASFIGWRFTSKTLKPPSFYGISRNVVCPKGRTRALNAGQLETSEEYIFFRL